MIRRLLLVLAGVFLAVASLSSSVWAHPGHDSISGTAPSAGAESPDQGTGAAQSWRALGRHAPPAAALVVVALVFAAAIPHPRRTLAFALMLPLALVSFEGVLHAALHLHHVPHAASLAIGASPAQPAATGPSTEEPSATPVIRLSHVAEGYEPPAPEIVIASSRGRAPPLSPA